MHVIVYPRQFAMDFAFRIEYVAGLGWDVSVSLEEDEVEMCELFEQYKRQGIRVLISKCKELGVSYEETVKSVKEGFGLPDEQILENMKLYW